MKNIVTVGGGTGSYVVLRALKDIENVKITALLTTADDGGIAKKERDEFGILPQSDIRKALIALADTNKNAMLHKLFTYRFTKGLGFKGATLGNLILIALTEIKRNQFAAIKEIEKIFNIKGEIIPTTLDPTNLLIKLQNNQEIFGETKLDTAFWNGNLKIKKLSLVPTPKIYARAKIALNKADYIIINPGDLYGSIISNIAIKGFSEAVNKSKAKIIYICNLVTKYGQTNNYDVKQHLVDLEKYLNKKIDIVVVNNQKFTTQQIIAFLREKSEPVKLNLEKLNKYKVYATNLISGEKVEKQKGDTLPRSFVRHSLPALKNVLIKIIKEN
mgnify:CR=1 FL=1